MVIIQILKKKKIPKMEMFANFRFVQDIAHQLVKPRPCSYMALDIWKHINNRELYHYENPHFQIPGDRTVSLHIIQNTAMKMVSSPLQSTCIVYLHGLSSFSIEGTFLIQNLEKHFSELNSSVCLYDLRGHGKDKGTNVTFGLQQSKQLYQILLFLKQQRKYKQFILWGRSMGATTILKMLNDFHQDIKENEIRIKYLVLDSAFCSIEKVATEIISRKSRMPQIFCKPLFEYLISTVQKLYKICLNINISNLQRIETNALFLYSEIDNLVSAEHSKILYNKYTGPKDKIQMNVGHNDPRPDNVLSSVFEKLKQCLKFEPSVEKRKSLSTKKIGLSVTKTKRIKTNQSAFDVAESRITQKFYELKTQQCNKENLKDEQNKTKQFSTHKSLIQSDDTKNLKNKNVLKIQPKIYKIAKDHNIKQLKLTKNFISLNGNTRNSVQLFKEQETNSSNLNVGCEKKEQKLKLSHINFGCSKKSEIYQEEPKHKTSIFEKVPEKKPQKQTKYCPQPQPYNADYDKFKQVKSAFLIRSTRQTVKNISPDKKQAQLKTKHDQTYLLHKKLSLNQPIYKPSNRCWPTNHITHPTAKPQSTNVNATKKKVSNLSNLNNLQKDLTNEITLGAKKKNLANIRKSIDLELLKIGNISPVYQSCVVSMNVTPQNSSQKVMFNFSTQEQRKMGSIQRLSNQHYM